MKTGVRIVNCARGELVDEAALRRGHRIRQSGGRRAGRFRRRAGPTRLSAVRVRQPCWPRRTSAAPPKKRRRSSACASPSRWWSICKNGVAINAVNMPALSPEQYRALGPYVNLAERLGNFAAHIATGNPRSRAPDLLRQHRRQQHQPAAQCRAGGRAEPLHRRQGEPGECHADRRAARLERGRRPRAPLRPYRFHPPRARDRHRHHHGGRRGAAGQAAPDAGGRHLLRSGAGRAS